MPLFFRLILLIFAIAIYCGASMGQISADNKPLRITLNDGDDADPPKSIQESLEKMRIEKDKKEHQEMVDQGEEAVKLSTEVKKSFDDSGRLSLPDLAKVARVEKLVKKIRSELGGNDGDEDDEKNLIPLDPQGRTSMVTNAVDSLKSKADALYDELQKTTRFTISAAAIFTSNAVLKLARTLRFGH